MSEQQVDLVVTGMTCASCAQRIERKLNKLDGVEARVNYATGLARVEFTPSVNIETLISTVEAAGYHALAPNPLLDEQVAKLEREHEQDLFRRWMIGAALAIPTAAISMIDSLHFAVWIQVVLLLSLPIVTWVAWPLHRTSFQNARHRTTTMDTLVSLGVIAAYVGSVYQWWKAAGHHQPHMYVEVAGVVPVFVLFGRWLESRNKRLAGSALRALIDATPKTAFVVKGSNTVETAMENIEIGDEVVIRPESVVPVDSVIIQGKSSVSTALLTGESMPQLVEIGDSLQAGAINYDGELRVQVTAIGSGTQISRIASLVAAAQSGKANIARLADRISSVFVPVVLVITALTGLAWYSYDSSHALDVMIAVLVIACPCALGLATPTALVVGSGRAASLGVLVAGPEVFEKSPTLNTIIFDKTGTLTTGAMTVTSCNIKDDDMAFAIALASTSPHPLSVAVVTYFHDVVPVVLTDVQTIAGLGIRARFNENVVEFGSRKFHQELVSESSTTMSHLFINGELAGSIGFADTLDPSAPNMILEVKKLGLTPIIASGDNAKTVAEIAESLGISEFYADLSPTDKIALVGTLQDNGRKVVMVGDGTNDAPALAAAELGIAMGRGTEVARATADITLLRPDLSLIAKSLLLSRKTLSVIKQNLWWAFGYNVAAIPLAMTGNLNPMIAGIAMSASSVLVVSNSLRLRTIKIS